jgi:hypothetical protein
MAVGAQECDAISGFNGRPAQGAAKAADAVGKLSIREPVVAAHDGGVSSKLLFCITQKTNGSERNVHKAYRLDRLAPVHDQHMPRDKARSLGCQEDRRSFQIMVAPEPAQGDSL